jgi:hypothetical protein
MLTACASAPTRLRSLMHDACSCAPYYGNSSSTVTLPSARLGLVVPCLADISLFQTGQGLQPQLKCSTGADTSKHLLAQQCLQTGYNCSLSAAHVARTWRRQVATSCAQHGAIVWRKGWVVFFLLVTRGAKSTGWPYTATKRT